MQRTDWPVKICWSLHPSSSVTVSLTYLVPVAWNVLVSLQPLMVSQTVLAATKPAAVPTPSKPAIDPAKVPRPSELKQGKARILPPPEKERLIREKETLAGQKRSKSSSNACSSQADRLARTATADVELRGQLIRRGDRVLLAWAAANHDPLQFADPDELDIARADNHHLAFAAGAHFCLGAQLARLEGRVALEEVLLRFPEWDVDLAHARLSPTSTVRGWETLPVVTR